VEAPTGHFTIVSSALGDLTLAQAGKGFKNVSECRVRGVTTTEKIVAKVKQVARTTVEESLFLDDLIRFMGKLRHRVLKSCSVTARPTATGCVLPAGP
jgi:hypothetical protein